MLHFFRKIRHDLIADNEFRKYFRYAVGEIALVVLGILIALQINNWDNHRIESAKISSYAKLLIKDLERDITMTELSRRQAARVVIRLDSLSRYLQNKNIEDLSNLDFLCLSYTLGYRPFSWSRATLEEMKNSGSLQYIESDSLKMKISQYDSFTYHLDQDYINDNINARNCSELISQVINKNYKNLKELSYAMGTYSKRSDWEENYMVYVNSKDRFDFFSSDSYQAAKAEGLDLLTKDVNTINVVMNNLISLKETLRMRADFELPKLINDAEELIELLNKTYLEQ